MIQPRLAHPDRVLILPELAQPVLDKIFKGQFRLGRCDRPIELRQITRMIWKLPLNQRDHITGNSVGYKRAGRWQ